MLFALHPWQSEAVLYIFARPIVLASLFVWLSIWAWGKRDAAMALLALVLALAAKEEAVALVPVLLLLSIQRQSARKDAFPLSLAAAIGTTAFLWTSAATKAAGTGAGFSAGVSPLTYIATQGQSLWRYLWQFFIPYPIVFDWQPEPAPAWHALWLALVLGIVWLLRKHEMFYWLLAALVCLAPTTSLFPLADLSAGRRLYLAIPFFGLFLYRQSIGHRAILTLFAVSSLFHAHLYSSPASLWRFSFDHTKRLRPALELARLVEPKEAISLLSARAQGQESNPDLHTEFGRIELARKNYPRALQHFGKALALDPARASHHYNRGVALLALGQNEAAQADFAAALRMDPNHSLAREALARLANQPNSPGK
jgi:tetratricopeptide (TPR) repeat protein